MVKLPEGDELQYLCPVCLEQCEYDAYEPLVSLDDIFNRLG